MGSIALAQQQSSQGHPAGCRQPHPQLRRGAAGPPRENAPAGDAALRQRIEQLEEAARGHAGPGRNAESLARGTTASPAPSAGPRQGPGPSSAIGAADAGRLDSIETQIRALAAQLEHVQEQVRALSARKRRVVSPRVPGL